MTEIMADPEGLARLADTVGKSASALTVDDLESLADCGSDAVTSVLSLFADDREAAAKDIRGNLTRTAENVMKTANDFSGTDAYIQASFEALKGN